MRIKILTLHFYCACTAEFNWVVRLTKQVYSYLFKERNDPAIFRRSLASADTNHMLHFHQIKVSCTHCIPINFALCTYLTFILCVTNPKCGSRTSDVAKSSFSDSSLGVIPVGCILWNEWRGAESTTILNHCIARKKPHFTVLHKHNMYYHLLHTHEYSFIKSVSLLYKWWITNIDQATAMPSQHCSRVPELTIQSLAFCELNEAVQNPPPYQITV